MSGLAELVERDRVCLKHGRVLVVTEKLDLLCPVGDHRVTRWGVGNPRSREVETAADVDSLETLEVPKATRDARKETEMVMRAIPGGASARQPAAPTEERGSKYPAVIVSQLYTNGAEQLTVKLRFCQKWAKPYRVSILVIDGKTTRRHGVLDSAADVADGRKAFALRCGEADRAGWKETMGAGGLTAIPAPKKASR